MNWWILYFDMVCQERFVNCILTKFSLTKIQKKYRVSLPFSRMGEVYDCVNWKCTFLYVNIVAGLECIGEDIAHLKLYSRFLLLDV